VELIFVKHLSVLSVALVAVTGCSLIKINGKSVSPSTSTTTTTGTATKPVPAGAAGGQASTPTGAHPDLVKVFLAVSWRDFEPSGYVGSGVVGKSGLKLGSSHSTGPQMGKPVYAISPDAAWLPGWNPRQSGSDDLNVQVAQAGINRTWQAQCFEDYAAFRTGWTQLEATYRPKLEQARALTNFYAQAAALREIYVALGADASKANLEVSPQHPDHWIGLRWEIMSTLLGRIAATKRDVARTHILGPIATDLASLIKTGRTWTTDETFERDAFCAAAMTSGTHRTPKLPTPRQTGWDLGPVAFPVSDDRVAELKTKLHALWAADRPKLVDAEAVNPDLVADGTTPVLASFNRQDPLVIDQVETKDGHTVVRATVKHSGAIGYDCRPTRQVESYNGDQPIYRKDCKTGTEVKITSVEVRFAELPEAAQLKKGEPIAFYGELTRKTTSSKVERGGALQTTRRDLVVDGRYLITK
jgi:hypothetical protein